MRNIARENRPSQVCHTVLLAILLATAFSLAYSSSVFAHRPPISGGGDSSSDNGSVGDSHSDAARRWPHRWNRWRPDWDRRWVRNWDPCWATFDNDTYINKKCVQRKVVEHPIESEKWTAIDKPGDDLPNFHEVHAWLFRGGQPNEDGLYRLYQMGVRTIVDFRSDPQQIESERQLCQQHELNFVSIPLSKTGAPSPQSISKFMQIAETARTRPDKGAVFAHCHLGGDRTGAMIAIYRQRQDKYSFAQAHEEMLNYGFHDSYTKLKTAVQNAKTTSEQPQPGRRTHT